MSHRLVVVMMPDEVPQGWMRNTLKQTGMVCLPREDDGKNDSVRGSCLILVDDALAPSKEVLADLSAKLGPWERLCAAVHVSAASQPAWIAALRVMPGDVSVRTFHHSKDSDYIFCAIHSALELHGDGLTLKDIAKFHDSLRAIDEGLRVDWALEAKLALLHACSECTLPAPIFPIHLIPESGPTQTALATIWKDARVPQLVGSIAASTDGVRRQEILRQLRDVLLPEG